MGVAQRVDRFVRFAGVEQAQAVLVIALRAAGQFGGFRLARNRSNTLSAAITSRIAIVSR